MSLNDKINSDIDEFLEKLKLKNPEYQISALGQLYYNVLNKMSNLGFKKKSIIPGKVRYQLPGFEVGSDSKTIYGAKKSTSQILGLKHLDDVSSIYTADHDSINEKLGDVDKVKEMIEALNTVLDNNLTDELGSTIEQKIQNQLKDNLNDEGQYTMSNGETIIGFNEITDAKNQETQNHLNKIRVADNTKEEVKRKAKEEDDKRIAEAERKKEEEKRKAEDEEEDDEKEDEEEDDEEDDEEEDEEEVEPDCGPGTRNENKCKKIDGCSYTKNGECLPKNHKYAEQDQEEQSTTETETEKAEAKRKAEEAKKKAEAKKNNEYKKGDFILVKHNNKYNIHKIYKINNNKIFSTKKKKIKIF